MDELLLAQIYALLTALGFATSDLAARYGLRSSTPISGMLMMVVMTLLMYGPNAVAGFRMRETDYVGLAIFFLAGVGAPGLGPTFHYMSFQRIGMARTISIVGSTPLLTVFIAVLALDERPTTLTYIGTVSIVAGVISLANEQRSATRQESAAKPVWTYFIFAVGSLLGFSAATALRKFAIQMVPNLSLALTVSGLGALLVIICWYPFLPPSDRFRFNHRTFWIFVVSGGLAALGHLALFAALQHGPLSSVAPLVYTTPLFAVAFSWIFFPELENLNFPVLTGAALICAGAILVTVSRG